MTNIPNNKEEMPLEHYTELFAAADPHEIAERTGLEYADGVFSFDFLNHRLTVTHPEFKLAAEPASRVLTSVAAEILVLRQLVQGTRGAWLGTFKSYRELPWGDVYDANFNGRCRIRLARTYGTRLDAFREGAIRLGGLAVKHGDAAFDFAFHSGITVRVIMHEGDDEFPAASQFLFSDNISAVWGAEDLAVLCEVIISALKEA